MGAAVAVVVAVGPGRCGHRLGGSGSPLARVCSPTRYSDTTPDAAARRGGEEKLYGKYNKIDKTNITLG